MSIKPLKLTFVISSLSSGGAERVMSTMANYWAKKGWGITLITLDSVDSDFYKLHPDIKRVALGLTGESSNLLMAIKNNFVRIVRLRREIRASKPDAIICFMEKTNILTLIATRGLGVKVVVSERTDPAHHEVGRLWNYLRRVTYSLADIIVAQNNQVKKWLEETVAGAKVVVIPNPINYQNEETEQISLNAFVGRKENIRTVVAMGRLGFEKGFAMLINAFAKITHSYPEWLLVIFGEGEERNNLTRLAHNLGISDKIFLPGTFKNSMSLLRQADLFVMSSRFEGFPNALLEAMACGLPVISTDCPSGPREIIRDGVDGILVPPENVDALAGAMDRLMSDENERKRLAARAPEVLERFGLEKIMGMWEETINELLERNTDEKAQ